MENKEIKYIHKTDGTPYVKKHIITIEGKTISMTNTELKRMKRLHKKNKHKEKNNDN